MRAPGYLVCADVKLTQLAVVHPLYRHAPALTTVAVTSFPSAKSKVPASTAVALTLPVLFAQGPSLSRKSGEGLGSRAPKKSLSPFEGEGAHCKAMGG
jgi:hypothetical protein